MLRTNFSTALLPGESPIMQSVRGASTQFASFNPNTLTQTGGIQLGNMNVANKFALKHLIKLWKQQMYLVILVKSQLNI